jgi:GDP-mannose 6-dehydrogenase
MDPMLAVRQSEISFLCVGTPSLRNGCPDTRAVERSCKEIGKALRSKKEFHWVAVRSTVLPGTTRSLVIPTIEAASGKLSGIDFTVCVNPEFTREGCAVADFFNPTITVLGTDDPAHLVLLRELYRGSRGQIFTTSIAVAEMVKYVCNTFHALKVTFANEIGTLCEQMDVDAQAVMKIFLSDTKLNVSRAYLTPGFAFGGSCLPKDVRALAYSAKQLDLDLPLSLAILPSNQAHLERTAEAVLATKRKKVGVLGLSFKSGTDDLRGSPLVQLVKRLLGEGCQIQIWDRDVSLGRLVGSNRQFIEEEIPHIGALLASDWKQVVRNSEVIVISTKAADEEILAEIGPHQVIVDLRSPLSRHAPNFSRPATNQSVRRFGASAAADAVVANRREAA